MFEKTYTMKDGVLCMRASEAGQMQVLEEATDATLTFDFEGNPRFPRQIIQTGKPLSYLNKGQVVNVPAGAYLAAYKYAAIQGKENLSDDKKQEKADRMEDFFIRPILSETAKNLMDSFVALKQKKENFVRMDVSGRSPENIAYMPVWIGSEEKTPFEGKKAYMVTPGVFNRMIRDENSVPLYQNGNTALKNIRYILKETPLTIVAKGGKGPRFNKMLAPGEIVALVCDGKDSERVYPLAPSEVKKIIASFTRKRTNKRTLFSFLMRKNQNQNL